jgi:N-dimethylarginine dimethylaminohydrolase
MVDGKLFGDDVFRNDLKRLWGDWGLCSEASRLEAVLLREPGREIENVDPVEARFREAITNPEKAREQHRRLAEVFKSNNVRVYYIEDMDVNCPNGYFVHDQFAMTPEGAILSRPALRIRRGEIKYTAKTLISLNIPIIRTIHGHGLFEGADLKWINEEAVVIGIGERTNIEGARQVMETLQAIGVKEFIKLPVPESQVHVDGLFNIISHDLAILSPWHVPHEFVKKIREYGFEVVEVKSLKEATIDLAANIVALEPNKIVMALNGGEETKKYLREIGVKIVEVDVSELMKGGGSISCMTGRLKRAGD